MEASQKIEKSDYIEWKGFRCRKFSIQVAGLATFRKSDKDRRDDERPPAASPRACNDKLDNTSVTVMASDTLDINTLETPENCVADFCLIPVRLWNSRIARLCN